MACFFDLSKAFDRVWHAGLIAKLSHYGVQDAALSWLQHYLTGRRQRVQVAGEVSDFLSIPAGVPQGSVLGPLLFLVYTIDLPHACQNEKTICSQFADDTALVATADTAFECERSLQESVSAAALWLEQWHLLVNARKPSSCPSTTAIGPHQHSPRSPLVKPVLQ